MGIARVPPELLDPVVAYFDPRRVILFGSRARGDAGSDSDIDLLVVLDDDAPQEMVSLNAGTRARSGYHQPAEVIPVREETFRRLSAIPGTLSRAAWLDGITVYERVPADMSESRPDPIDRRNSVLGWARIARADLRAVQRCLVEPPELGVAAYHCQQAAEKALKGFLVTAGTDFGKTHDLDGLGRSVIAAFPALATLVEPLRGWTDWGVAYRYPNLPQSPPEPSSEELTSAVARIDQLVEALERSV